MVIPMRISPTPRAVDSDGESGRDSTQLRHALIREFGGKKNGRSGLTSEIAK
jgi:hypothetical protein